MTRRGVRRHATWPVDRLMALRARRFDRHLRRWERRWRRLTEGAPADPDALALLAVESWFRPRPARLVEYATWALWSLGPEPLLRSLSVGIAQAQLGHWHRTRVLDGVRLTPGRLGRVLRLQHNLEVCAAILADAGAGPECSARAVTRAYTGGQRAPFVALMGRARDRARRI